MWKKYAVIYKRSKEFKYKDRLLIKKGCTIDDPEPKYVSQCNDIEKAKRMVEGTTAIIHDYYDHYLVIEFACDIWQRDENGNVEFTGDIESFSKMEIKLVKKPGYDLYGIYDNLEEAEKAKEEYETNDGECDLFIVFQKGG